MQYYETSEKERACLLSNRTNSSTAEKKWMVLPMCSIYSIYNYLLLTSGAFSRHTFKNIYFSFSIYMPMLSAPLKGTDEETPII